MTNIANPRAETLYGFPQPNQKMNPLPIIANRAPTSADKGYPIGQAWIYKNNGGYELVGVSQGLANWQATSGSGAVASVSGTANQITATNSSGAITLSLPNAITAPGSISATTSVSSTTTMTAGTGLTATTGNIVATAGNISATAGSLSAGTTVTAGTGITATTGNITATNGNLVLSTAGNCINIKAGTNAKAGIAVLSGGAVVVSNVPLTANSSVLVTNNGPSGTAGALRVTLNVAGSSMTIDSSEAGDNSTVSYFIFERS